MSAVAVCKLSDLAPGSAAKFQVGDRAVAVVRLGDDVYAIGDMCSHAEISLADGEVLADDCEIECWKHGSRFSLKTGVPQTLPATVPVAVYIARVVDGMVEIETEGAAA
ncbi:MAG: Rieske 2Fe-2S domain-containing protein [Actinobacteria bacterium]|uniref:Unannotated protein n=1 Tax=freshwater metagenome TaxID=449393 RepID=A0A6J7C471_9ZZZZ|nr:Rieske 2Fe-2S domain-containing protein [Actinomycetota bacterium]MSW79227.1 Rieske 2Fe-2S domain-containing protein [Actinomycetota bacterium]MSX55676.1 Rieske 2Fe-2S domain-containing protein [Actinomycetota bacterium]MSX92675.1 Rieske 2Fe-2S domain-containing protein [Actinomycetota bacterium]MSZ81525.1 Rieske 2Fe-2S domain-containing protein [Actinomycetota bacterium]